MIHFILVAESVAPITLIDLTPGTMIIFNIGEVSSNGRVLDASQYDPYIVIDSIDGHEPDRRGAILFEEIVAVIRN